MSEYDQAVAHLAKQIAKQVLEQRTETAKTTIVEEYGYLTNVPSGDIEFFVNEQLPEDLFQKTIDAYKQLLTERGQSDE